MNAWPPRSREMVAEAAFQLTGIISVVQCVTTPSSFSSRNYYLGTDCRRSRGTVLTARHQNCSARRLSWQKKRVQSGSIRKFHISSVSQSCPRIGEGHGNRRPDDGRSCRVRCSQEQEGTLRDDQGRNKSGLERSSPGSESIPSQAPGKVQVRLLQRLSQTLTDRQLLRPGQTVLLAVSGGQDSVCLMHLLVKLQSKWGWKVGIAHCDHQWSPSARKQAAHVAQMAQGLGLDYYQALTTESVLGEGVARTWRYGVLQRIAVSHGYEAIVTAHTASDRVETLLFNIFRGTGLQGLQSLTWKRSVSPELSLSRKSAFQVIDPVGSVEDPQDGITAAMPTTVVSLVRPLLGVTRTELRELWEELKLPLWPDPSNLSLDIDRNRIRQQLLPYLRRHFNPGVDKSLARWAEIVCGDQVYLDQLCESIRVNAESELNGPGAEEGGRVNAESELNGPGFGEGGRKLDVSVLKSLPMALQRRVLKQFADGFTGKSLGFDTVERVRQACADLSSAKKGLQVSIPGGYYLRVHGNALIVARSSERKVPK